MNAAIIFAVEENIPQNPGGWQVISFPFSDNITEAVMFDSANGWAFSTHKFQLYRLKNHQWKRIEFPKHYKIEELFGISPNNIWVGCYDRKNYQNFLLRFDGTNWHNIYPPNTDRIKDLQFLSENSIWGACVWGEIIHYDGKEWELIPAPTFFHLDQLYFLNDTLGCVWSEYRNGKGYILLKKKEGWEPIELTDLIFFNATKGIIQTFNADSFEIKLRSILDKKPTVSQYFSMLVKNTVTINCYNNENPIFSFTNGTVYKKGFTFQFKNAKTGEKVILLLNDKYKGYKNNFLISDTSVSKVNLINTKSIVKNFHKNAKMSYLNEYGVVFLDVNNDGLEDIFSIDTNRENRLHLSAFISTVFSQEKNFVDAAEKYNLIGLNRGEEGNYIYDMGATAADMDNDSDRDIYVTSLYDNNMLFKNVKAKSFREIGDRAGVTAGKTRSNVGIWGDVDNDGDVDLFVTNEDTTNMLFLNKGNRRFEDITELSGLISTRGGKGATFGDLDGDGDLDLVVPNYSLANRIYRNEGIHPKSGFPFFNDVTEEWLPAGQDSLAKSASACLGDYDNDGDLDLYIANMVFSNRLYQNDGTGHFSDVTEAVGLLDSSLSNSSCFFDADNDGDLDLFVTNRGPNLFFKNEDGKKFIRDNELFALEPIAFSTGFACGDPDNDGDLDCYLANDDKYSIYYDNKHNNKNFLEIKLIGTRSNRDAIGAKAYLYEAGYLGLQSNLLGFREINGGSGFGCMNSTTIHFGADSSEKYDLKIWFPSGIVINRTKISPSQILTIWEQNGLARFISNAKRTLLRYMRSPAYQYEFLEFVVLVLSIVLALKYFIHRGLFESRIQKYALVFPLVIYIFISFFMFESSYTKAHLMPLSVTLATFIAIVLLNRTRIIRVNRERLAEELLLSCKIFDHGSWATTYLNQLQLFSVNLPPNESIGEHAGQKLSETITGFYHQVYNEIERIAQISQEADIKSYQGEELNRQLLFLSENLNKIKVSLAMQHGIEAEIWNNVYRLVDQIRMNIREINYGAVKFFSCDVFEVLKRTITAFHEQGKTFLTLIQPIADGKTMHVCIKPGELAPILENLITNANRATQHTSEPKIEINYRQTDQHLFLEISDNGIGIAKNMWETIFQENITTRIEPSGGLGLFYSRKTLEKYGGSIHVVRSSKNKRTTFSIKLKRV